MRRVLQVEETCSTRLRGHLARECCLSDLPSADQANDWRSFEGGSDAIEVPKPRDHALSLS